MIFIVRTGSSGLTLWFHQKGSEARLYLPLASSPGPGSENLAECVLAVYWCVTKCSQTENSIILLLQQPFIIAINHTSHGSGDGLGSGGGSCFWVSSSGCSHMVSAGSSQRLIHMSDVDVGCYLILAETVSWNTYPRHSRMAWALPHSIVAGARTSIWRVRGSWIALMTQPWRSHSVASIVSFAGEIRHQAQLTCKGKRIRPCLRWEEHQKLAHVFKATTPCKTG